MARTTEQNEAMRAATRASIETAAVHVFARHGFAASSIRQIANRAELSIGSIYRHYASKEELFEALLGQASAGLEMVAAQLSVDDDPLAVVRAFTETYLSDLMADDGAAEFFMVMNQGFITDTPVGTTHRLAAAQRTLWGVFADVIRKGQATGHFAEGDADQITASYFALLAGMTTMRVAMRDEFAAPDVELTLRLLTGGES